MVSRTAQKMNFFVKDFCSKYEQILKKFAKGIEVFIFTKEIL